MAIPGSPCTLFEPVGKYEIDYYKEIKQDYNCMKEVVEVSEKPEPVDITQVSEVLRDQAVPDDDQQHAGEGDFLAH